MKTKNPLDSVGWLGGSSNRLVINEAARKEATMKPWSIRIPAAIADGKVRLDGNEYVLIPPHIGGNETKLTLVLTAGEVALAEALWETMLFEQMKFYGGAGQEPSPALIEFTEKMEALNHD